MKVSGRTIVKGVGVGEVLVCAEPISFLGGVDAKTGIIADGPAKGKCVKGKVLVFPRGKGSTVGSYVMFQLKKNNAMPVAIVNLESEIIVAVGAIISEIPMIDKLEKDPFTFLKDGMRATVDATNGFIEVKE